MIPGFALISDLARSRENIDILLKHGIDLHSDESLEILAGKFDLDARHIFSDIMERL